jgi:hypothetical protein
MAVCVSHLDVRGQYNLAAFKIFEQACVQAAFVVPSLDIVPHGW